MKKTILFLCVALLGATHVWADHVEIDGVYYNLDRNSVTAQVTHGDDKYSGSVVFPDSVTYGASTYNVTSIGTYAFRDCTGLTSVTIPNSVTSIGYGAFNGCTGLTSITLSNSVTSIGTDAFWGCTGLTSITIPNGVTSIGSSVFKNCSSLTSVTIPNSVTSIGNSAFSGCSSLTSVTIPNSVASIGSFAFCDVPNIVYSGTATGAPWGARSLNGYVEGNLVYRDATKTELLACSAAATGEITIPNTVTSIGNNAFYYCISLTSITIPNGVTSIGGSAFYNCSSLTSITIPNSVTSIGGSAFYDVPNIVYSGTATGAPWGARSLNGYVEGNLVYRDATKTELLACFAAATGEITIPNSVTSIGEKAFDGCTGLTSVTIPNSVTSIGSSAFSGCTGLTSITIPNSVTSIGQFAFGGCGSLTSITIPNSVQSIGYSAFDGCTGLTSITLPNNVTSIRDYAFYGCTGLTSITIPNSVTSIGEAAFSACSSLTSVTIPNSVTSIGNDAFYNCSSLTSVSIPNSVTSIGNYAFNNVPNIVYSGTATGAPWGARSLNGYVEGNLVYRDATKTELLACFAAATGEITIPNSVTSIDQGAFQDCRSLTSITIPTSVTSIGIWAFANCSSLTSITIPNRVTSIGPLAFEGCRSLTSVTIGNSVTSIGYWAFYYCSSLTSITIPNSVTSIGEDAFHGCSSLEDIFVPCGELERFTQMFNDSYNSDYSDKLKIASSPHTLTIKDTKYGTVSVPDYNGCDESVMITAIPDPHCRFVKWSDGNTDNPRPVYLTEDITLEAIFDYTLTDKCGKDYLLTWTLDTLKMAMDITGKGSLSDNYTYHTTFASLTIGNEVTTIGANAFSDCDNLQYLTLGSSVRVIESGAFACSDIKTITCYNKRPPTVNNDAFCNLDYETIIYVPKDYLENYQMHAFWGMFDVRPIGASGTETDKVKVEPAETTATVAWPTISGAGSYELVIRDKDGNALCTLVFNAQGQLTSIDFAAVPARDRSNVAAMAQGAGFAFTVTGLESGTMYKYSFITKNASGTVIDTKTGAFTTQSPTALEDIMDNVSSSSSVRKVLQNGQLYILRDGKVYNAVGAEVK